MSLFENNKELWCGKLKLISLIIVMMLLIPAASAWISGYEYRIPIDINITANNCTDCQYNFTVDIASLVSAGKVNANGSGCCVANETDSLRSFWNQTVFNTSNTKIQVNASSLNNVSNTTNYFYYGGPGTTPLSDIIGTMLFGEDCTEVISISWIKHPSNPVMDYGTGWESVNVLDPWVIYNISGDDIYHMWYSGLGGGVAQIGYANSTDGITWTKYTGNPIISVGATGTYDDLYAHKISVVLKDGTYYGYYSAQKSGGNRTIAMATAPNPWGPWTKNASNPILSPTLAWEDGFYDTPSVLYDSDETIWKMWYGSGTLGGGEPESWSYANSTDGVTWTNYASNPIAQPPGTGGWNSLSLGGSSVSKIDGIYHNYHNGFDNSQVSTIGYITSSDGISWDISNDTQIIGLGASGAWDSAHAYRACMQIIDGIKTIWYNGAYSGHERIGIANYTSQSEGLDPNKWIKVIGTATDEIELDNGTLLLYETEGGTGNFDGIVTKTYKPPVNSIIETRTSRKWTGDTGGTIDYTILTATQNQLSASNDQHLFYTEIATSTVRHQTRSGGSWGGEDVIWNGLPIEDEFYNSRLILESTKQSYYIYDDAGVLKGSLIDNTDSPQGFAGNYYLSMQAREAYGKVYWLFVRKLITPEPTVSLRAEESAPSAPSAPNITSWQNNKTSNNDRDITINTSQEVNFNAIANQSITTWNWYKDDVNQSHNFDNITLNWSATGLKHVIVNATNTNGTSSSITWNVTVNNLTDDLQISNPNPIGNFDIETTDAQILSATLNHIGTTIWYIDGTESHTDHNSTTPDYYFTSSETGTFNVTMISTDSCFTQDSFTWFITVISTSQEPESVSVPYYGSSGIIPFLTGIEEIKEEYFDDMEEYLGKIKIEMSDEIEETSKIWKIALGLLIIGIIFSGFLCYKISKDDEYILPRKKQ